ncbi:MAG: sporulation transcription factor Spo0A [Lachnospiraceae bacterium]|nr:sporulation transcription factor Spo0A [Lachnospiraceae bacterium]
MECLKVAIADCDLSIHRSLQRAIQRDGELQFAGGARDGAEARKLICEKQPDVAIVDMVMPKIDGFALIEQIRQDKMIRKEPKFILTTSVHNDQIMAEAFRLGVSYFLLKPYDPQMLANRVKQIAGYVGSGTETACGYLGNPAKRYSDADNEALVKDMLHRLGVPAHLRGYRYMITAILAVLRSERMMECVTKELYPFVAKTHDSTATRVERALRHAIEVAWGRGNIEEQEKLFGYTVNLTKGKPTNSEFIAMVANQIQSR